MCKRISNIEARAINSIQNIASIRSVVLATPVVQRSFTGDIFCPIDIGIVRFLFCLCSFQNQFTKTSILLSVADRTVGLDNAALNMHNWRLIFIHSHWKMHTHTANCGSISLLILRIDAREREKLERILGQSRYRRHSFESMGRENKRRRHITHVTVNDTPIALLAKAHISQAFTRFFCWTIILKFQSKITKAIVTHQIFKGIISITNVHQPDSNFCLCVNSRVHRVDKKNSCLMQKKFTLELSSSIWNWVMYFEPRSVYRSKPFRVVQSNANQIHLLI